MEHNNNWQNKYGLDDEQKLLFSKLSTSIEARPSDWVPATLLLDHTKKPTTDNVITMPYRNIRILQEMGCTTAYMSPYQENIDNDLRMDSASSKASTSHYIH